MDDKPAVRIITIDGPTASGKGTIASEVARKLGFHYLDSGALFRLAALSCLTQKVDLTDEAACSGVTRQMRPCFKDGKVFLGDKDVTDAIREEAVGLAASRVATMASVGRRFWIWNATFAEHRVWWPTDAIWGRLYSRMRV